MSTATISSYAFSKPKSLYDSIKKSDYMFFRKNTLNDDNIFGREKHSYIYDVPKSGNVTKKGWSDCIEFEKNLVTTNFYNYVSLDQPTNYKNNGLHLCQNAEKIKRYEESIHFYCYTVNYTLVIVSPTNAIMEGWKCINVLLSVFCGETP